MSNTNDVIMPPAALRSLPDLPDEIIFMVLKHLDTPRDLAALARTCKRAWRWVELEGWPVFVKTHFRLITIPDPERQAGLQLGRHLAESVTYQTTCWERRSIRFTAMHPAPQNQNSRRGGQTRGLAFPAIVDASYDTAMRREMVVWGAGENIVARYRQRGVDTSRITTYWRQHSGAAVGYRPGRDDIKALKILKLPEHPDRVILVGRENGDIDLLSAKADMNFGRKLANFSAEHAQGLIGGASAYEIARLRAINSLDVFQDDSGIGLIAAARDSRVMTYRLPAAGDSNPSRVPPSVVFELHDFIAWGMRDAVVLNAKWMGDPFNLAIALNGNLAPLRWLSITPDGWMVNHAARNDRLEAHFPTTGAVLPSSIQPVKRFPGPGSTPLLLSAWKDGKVRLQDLRSPSPFDVVYQDNVQPNSMMHSLLVWGSDKFIGGDATSARITIFDFRWPRAYHRSDNLPCGGYHPFLPPTQLFTGPPPDPTNGRPCCDHLRGFTCRYHELSRNLYYRPNAMMMLENDLPRSFQRGARVCSMAKATDISPNFYIGIQGGVIEATLGPTETGEVDPNLGFPAENPPKRTGYLAADLNPMMMEIGDGLASPVNNQPISVIRFPRTRRLSGSRETLDGQHPVLRRAHRLDSRYQVVEDFQSPELRAWAAANP